MKNLFKILAIAFIGFFIISCEKDEDQAVMTETTKGKISPDKTILILDKSNPDNVALNVVWNRSAFDLPVAVPTQQLQFAIKGKNFQGASSVEAVNSPLALSNKQLNSLALSLGGTPNVAIEIEVRLQTLIGATSFYSNVVTLTVTPYLLGPVYNYTDLYLIGDATAGAWDNIVTNAKIYPLQKTSSPGVYSYTGYFAQGGFKIIKTPGSWDTQYGMGSPGILSTSGASGNITVAGSGYYNLTINTTALTYTFTAVTPPTTTYTSISMIGTASGDWNTDVDMQQSAFDSHIWVKKNVLLNSGEFKFRANHAWTTGWGVDKEFFGIATTSGGNIPLTTSFHYDVYFNDITGAYSAIPFYP